MRLSFSRRALAQIDEIRTYVEADDPRAATVIVRRIETVAQLVARHPAGGRPTTIKRVRVFSILPYPYLLFYEANEETG